MAKPRTLTSRAIADAECHLRMVDAAMGALIIRDGPCSLSTRREPAFRSLAWSIIGQQLSAKAAATITNRVAALVPHPFEPQSLMRVSPDQLRQAGMSRRKVGSLISGQSGASLCWRMFWVRWGCEPMETPTLCAERRNLRESCFPSRIVVLNSMAPRSTVPKLPQLLDRKIYKTGQTRGADDDVIFQNRVGRNSTVLIRLFTGFLR